MAWVTWHSHNTGKDNICPLFSQDLYNWVVGRTKISCGGKEGSVTEIRPLDCQPMVLIPIEHQQKSQSWDFIECKQLNCATANLYQLSCNAAKLEKSTAVKQLNSATDELWNSMAVRKPWAGSSAPIQKNSSTLGHETALLYSSPPRQDSFFLFLQDSLGGAVLAREMHSPLEKERAVYEPQKSLLLLREVPIPGPWLAHSHANEDFKSSVWLVQKAVTLIGQWRC